MDMFERKTTYVLDPESAAEMARLMRQENLVTRSLGGVFPENPDLSNIERILDLACGPGGWVLETAFEHRDMEVYGVDISSRMVAYAQAQAQAQRLDNTHFAVMDVLKPFAFPDNFFDIVNARLVVTFMPPSAWPDLLLECKRILRPGGMVRFTDMEWGFANTSAFEGYCALFNQALYRAGQSFSPDGRHLGLLPVLQDLVRKAKFSRTDQFPYVIDLSYGTEAHEGYYLDLASAFHQLQPFLKQYTEKSQADIAQLCDQALLEMQREDFLSQAFFLLVRGFKE